MRLPAFLAAMLLVATPALAAQPADAVYACTRGGNAIGDIEIAGATLRSRTPGGEFGESLDYMMLDDVSMYLLSEPEILTAGGYRVDNVKVTELGFDVTVLAEGASEFEIVSCTAG